MFSSGRIHCSTYIVATGNDSCSTSSSHWVTGIAFESFGDLVEVVHNGPMRTSNQRCGGNANDSTANVAETYSTANENPTRIAYPGIHASCQRKTLPHRVFSNSVQAPMDESIRCLEFCAFLGRSEPAGGRTDRQLTAPLCGTRKQRTMRTTGLALSISFVTDVPLSRNKRVLLCCRQRPDSSRGRVNERAKCLPYCGFDFLTPERSSLPREGECGQVGYRRSSGG
jgi:hypothetical protein